MKLTISREAKIGALVIITLGAAIWGFNFLSGKNIFKKTRQYYAIYTDVGGLSEGSPVQVNGYNVGAVSSIGLMKDRPGLLLVTFRITEKNFQFPRDSEAKLVSAGFLSGRVLEIILGKDSIMAQSGDTLQTGFELDLQEQVNSMVQPLKEKVDKLLSGIDSILIPIQSILNEESAKDLANALGRIPKIMQNIEKATADVSDLLASEKTRLGRIMGNVESISANLRNNNDKISSILENVDEITDSISKSNFKQAIQNATGILEKVDEMVAKINNGEGTLGALIHDDKLYMQLDSAANNLNSLISDLEHNPERYLHFSFIHINKKVNQKPPKNKKNKRNKESDTTGTNIISD